jgi:hypothetical protein
MPSTIGETRWERLERYCRWKQGRLRIDRLPNDTVLQIIGHLIHADVCALLNALYAVPRKNIQSRREALLVPQELRSEWLYGAACDSLRRIATTIGEIAFFHARDCTHVCAHVDWSVFSGPCMPVPLSLYEWSSARSAVVDVNESEVWRIVRDASATGRTAVTIALYRYIFWGNAFVMHPEPCHRMVHSLFPYFLASESRYSGHSWKNRCDAGLGGSDPSGVVPTTR